MEETAAALAVVRAAEMVAVAHLLHLYVVAAEDLAEANPTHRLVVAVADLAAVNHNLLFEAAAVQAETRAVRLEIAATAAITIAKPIAIAVAKSRGAIAVRIPEADA